MQSLQNKRILIFGDSLSHRGHDNDPPVSYVTSDNVTRNSSVPGDLLASYLIKYGGIYPQVRINAKVSRSAWNFFRIEPFEKLLNEDLLWNPDIVIVFLGTNDLGLSAAKDKEAFEKIKRNFDNGKREFIAIGPPSFASTKLNNDSPFVVDTLKKVFGVSNFIDSRYLTKDLIGPSYRSRDSVHFTNRGAHRFAEQLASRIALLVNSDIVVLSPLPPLPSKVANSIAITKANLTPLLFGIGGGLFLLALGLNWAIRRRQSL